MFCGVLLLAPKPSTARHPSHQADDIGARFGEPSSFRVLTSTNRRTKVENRWLNRLMLHTPTVRRFSRAGDPNRALEASDPAGR